MDTVGLVNFEIEQDTENRSLKELHDRVYNNIYNIAKKLDSIARDEKSFDRISLHEGGKYGAIRLIPHFGRDTTKATGLYIALLDSLFREDIVLKFYEYSKTIPYQVWHSQYRLLIGKMLLERVGLLPAAE